MSSVASGPSRTSQEPNASVRPLDPGSGNPTPASGANTSTKLGRRAAAACTRCRRYRQKCIMPSTGTSDGVTSAGPCQSCRAAGKRVAATCTVLPRGFSAADRNFRRRRRPSEDDDEGEERQSTLEDTRSSPDASAFYDDSLVLNVQTLPVPKAGSELESSSEDVNDREASTLSEPPKGPLKRASSAIDHVHHSPPHQRPRQASSLVVTLPSPTPRLNPLSPLLPPPEEVVEGVSAFLHNYMQLGFLPRSFFLDQVVREPQSVSVFLLLAILSLSARFTPSLVERYGGRQEASSQMTQRALSLIADEMVEASLERVQAFFVLATAQFGEGNGGRAWLLFGIAIRMAATLNLHKESSYSLAPNATPEDIMRSEMARRSFWLVYIHDQQIAGRSPSTTFPPSTIDVLLPCEEDDFLFGQCPASRSALPGTLGANLSLGHVVDPDRSLFSTMVIGQWLWARVAEKACKPVDSRTDKPWLPNDEFMCLQAELAEWESKLPTRQRFTPFVLRAMKGKALDMGFLSIGVLLRLSNIVLRRTYLPWMAAAIEPDDPNHYKRNAPPEFWSNMSLAMVQNALALCAQIEAYMAVRKLMEGFPAVFVFAVYMCGDIAYFISRWPNLCPSLAASAPGMLQTSLRVLGQLEEAWPLAARWRSTLQHLMASTAPLTVRAAADEQRALDEEDSIFRDYQSRATPVFQTSPSNTMRSGPEVMITPPAIQPAFVAPQPQLPLSTVSSAPAQTFANQRFSLPDGTLPSDLLSTLAPATSNQVPMPFVPHSVTAENPTADLDLDVFGSDVTAFLRGEPVEWFAADGEVNLNLPF